MQPLTPKLEIRNSKFEINYQNGGSYLWVIILIITLPLIGLVFFKPKTTLPMLTDNDCVFYPPLTTQTVKYNGADYQLIGKNEPVIIRELFKDPKDPKNPQSLTDTDHLIPDLVNKATVTTEGKAPYQATAWKVKLDAQQNPQSETWRPADGVDNLIYVDVTDQNPNADTGYVVFDIYLKAGTPLPRFIQDYCNLKLPTKPIALAPEGLNDTIPPTSVDYQGNKYYLFSYEAIDGPAHLYTLDTTKHPNFAQADMELTINGQDKTYQTYYNPDSFIQYLILVDKNPVAAQKVNGHQLIYKYVKQQFYNPTNFVRPSPSPEKDLQLLSAPIRNINPWGWWSPECKPAIYLYPQTPTQVSVQVNPNGFLTYTKPQYPAGGWNVLAQPNGQISTNNQTYDYLYYESKINDAAITKPTTGYVVKPDQLEDLYRQILPKLGLNPKETQDYIDYWHNLLPKANYYFIGLMSENAIHQIEPLTISPTPDTTIRVRLFYQALDTPISVTPPTLSPITARQGFTVVEWGGLVKNDQNHPFTCSQ